MSNLKNKFIGRIFRRIDGLVWDLQSNQVGTRDNNGIYTLSRNVETVGEGATPRRTVSYGVSVNPFDAFSFAIPAFAQNTPLEAIDVGDIIIGDKGALGWVVDKKPNSLVLHDKNGMTKQYTPPKTSVLGVEGALVVKSLTSLFGSNGAAGLQNSLLPLLMLNDGGLGDLEDLLPVILLSQQQAGDNANALQSILPILLLGKKGGSGGLGDMLPLLMMSGGLGGLGGGAQGGMGSLLPFLLMDRVGGEASTLVDTPALNPAGRIPSPALQRESGFPLQRV